MSFVSLLSKSPTIKTQKALLLLDFQTDFLRPSGALYVPNTARFIEELSELTSAFRRSGKVIWVRSRYEMRRPEISPDTQEVVVLQQNRSAIRKNLRSTGTSPDQPDLDALEHRPSVNEEAFLSSTAPQCCRPQSLGAQFPASILAAIDAEADSVIEKSDYSALTNGDLILTLRTCFVSELWICGSLSNISVYATVRDAVRYGFSVNLVKDCLGFRKFALHEEAMRRMTNTFGASSITMQELYKELVRQETDDAVRRNTGDTVLTSLTEIERY